MSSDEDSELTATSGYISLPMEFRKRICTSSQRKYYDDLWFAEGEPRKKCSLCKQIFLPSNQICFCEYSICLKCVKKSKFHTPCGSCNKSVNLALSELAKLGDELEPSELQEMMDKKEKKINHTSINTLDKLSKSSKCLIRNFVYKFKLWVNPETTGSLPENTPSIYEEDRIIPWLERELLALGANNETVCDLSEVIFRKLASIPLGSSKFFLLLYPFLKNFTAHFIYEFFHFSNSSYDVDEYDRATLYSIKRNCFCDCKICNSHSLTINIPKITHSYFDGKSLGNKQPNDNNSMSSSEEEETKIKIIDFNQNEIDFEASSVKQNYQYNLKLENGAFSEHIESCGNSIDDELEEEIPLLRNLSLNHNSSVTEKLNEDATLKAASTAIAENTKAVETANPVENSKAVSSAHHVSSRFTVSFRRYDLPLGHKDLGADLGKRWPVLKRKSSEQKDGIKKHRA